MKKQHYMTAEAIYFEEFIFSALKERGLEKNGEYILGDEYASRMITEFDGYLPNGLTPRIEGHAFLEVKYTNNAYSIKDYISKVKETVNHKYQLVIICLVSPRKLGDINKYHNIKVLGADYVRELANKYPIEWLAFSVSCRPEDNIISYDSENETFILSNKTLAHSEVLTDYKFSAKDIKKLSDINKQSFKNEIRIPSRNPALFIGNGASVCFGSDLWKPLCDYLFDYLNPKHVDKLDLVRKAIGNTTFSLSSMTKCLIDSNKYYSAIYSSLYRKYEPSMHDSSTLIRSAVRVKEHLPNMPVITYNYDDFFEIDYNKYTSRTISSVENQQQDNTTVEPKIRHVHGLFPYGMSTLQPQLVLTQEEYYDAYRYRHGHVSWTPDIQKYILKNNVCLFIGSSMSDLYQMSLIDEIYNEYYSGEQTRPWKCFALLCFKELTPRDIYSVCNYYASKGVHVIFTDDFKDLPAELLKIFGL